MNYRATDMRPAVVVDDGARVEMLGAGFACEQTAVLLRNVRDALIEPRTRKFGPNRNLELRGADCRNIVVTTPHDTGKDGIVFAEGAGANALLFL